VNEEAAEQRPEDDDYDLLTYGEAGARLRTEIKKQTQLLEELEERMQVADNDLAHEIAAVQSRISELKDAAQRQTAQQNEAADFERFFGYDPKQRP
jgi:excinuclease UvrABC nuclease subunit